MSRPATAVSVEGLRVVRGGVPVLDGLSPEVDAGSVTGLVGPSGGRVRTGEEGLDAVFLCLVEEAGTGV